jgi:hypothetical protein
VPLWHRTVSPGTARDAPLAHAIAAAMAAIAAIEAIDLDMLPPWKLTRFALLRSTPSALQRRGCGAGMVPVFARWRE